MIERNQEYYTSLFWKEFCCYCNNCNYNSNKKVHKVWDFFSNKYINKCYPNNCAGCNHQSNKRNLAFPEDCPIIEEFLKILIKKSIERNNHEY